MTPEELKKLCEDLEHYETPVWAAREILKHEILTRRTIDPCCGSGILSDAAAENNYAVQPIDVYDWGYKGGNQSIEKTIIADFLAMDSIPNADNISVFMNPPFLKAEHFVQKCFEIGVRKIVCFQRFAWWESNGRDGFWDKYTPQRIHICGSRATCWRHDITAEARKKTKGSTPTAHAFFVWERGQPAGPVLGRIYNPDGKGRK